MASARAAARGEWEASQEREDLRRKAGAMEAVRSQIGNLKSKLRDLRSQLRDKQAEVEAAIGRAKEAEKHARAGSAGGPGERRDG